jgi:hypothetical protein
MSLVRSGTSQLRYGARIQRGGRRHRERLPTAAGREPDVPSNLLRPAVWQETHRGGVFSSFSSAHRCFEAAQ